MGGDVVMFKDIYCKSKELIYCNTYVHIVDDTSVIVENCSKILEYNDIYVLLKANELKVAIWGKSLKVDVFDNDSIRVKGSIRSVEYSR